MTHPHLPHSDASCCHGTPADSRAGSAGHGHAHSHDHAHDAHGNPFWVPFLAIALFSIVELVGGIWTQSLALLSDAWHMFSDVAALGLAMWAAQLARHRRRSLRAEWWVSVVNALLMLLVCVWIVIEAIERFHQPRPVAGGYASVIAVLGLLVNLYVAKHLHHQHHHHGGDANLNQRAAFLHVLGDLLGSLAAVVAGVVIYYTGWMVIDPILSLFISVLLLAATLQLLRDIARGAHAHSP